MVRVRGGWLLFAALSLAAPTEDTQYVLDSTPARTEAANPRKLQGRFLHITDLHPDPYYKLSTNPEGDHPCHAGEGPAKYYGAYLTECDSPFTLVNATFDWIRENLKDEIDFVVWTGDSARHDNDDDIPRSSLSVENLNRFIVQKFVEVFGKTDNINDPDPTNDFVVPIVPTFGNNDILPHNIFEPGPNRWTRTYIDIWNKFVPEEQRHSFARGGWYFTEVIPNTLAVFSLNSLYFFDNNAAVDGCDLKSEPGYEHMEWLRIQLQFIRERGMKAILIGHVPPLRTENKQAWDETCYQKYTLWLRQYRDVIVANIYGHVNYDHFTIQDVKDLKYNFKIDGIDQDLRSKDFELQTLNHDDFHLAVKPDYLNDLRSIWSKLPSPPSGMSYTDTNTADSKDKKKDKKKKKKPSKADQFLKDIGGHWGERFSLTLISPSVVPNYFPSLRVIEYNISGLDNAHPKTDFFNPHANRVDAPLVEDSSSDDVDVYEIESYSEQEKHDLSAEKKKKKKKKKKPAKPDFTIPKPPPKTAPPGPAYSPQTLSLLSMTQYYANLSQIHDKMEADLAKLQNRSKTPVTIYDLLAQNNTKYFGYEVEYITHNDTYYKMKDLTVPSWLDLAEKIGRTDLKHKTLDPLEEREEPEDDSDVEDQKEKKKKKKGKSNGEKLKKNALWHAFVRRAFVSSRSEEDLADDFG